MVIHSRSLARRISLLALSAAAPAIALAQASSPTMPPLNDLPNPYHTDTTWAKLPAGRTWGSTSAVAIDRDGKSIWVAERCGANSCGSSTLDPVMKFDANGNVVAHFGGGMFVAPHGILVDKDDNIWVVDCACTGGGGRRGGAGGAPARSAAAAANGRRPRRRFDRAAQGTSDLQVQPRRQAADARSANRRRARPGLLLPAERDPHRAERRHLRRRGPLVGAGERGARIQVLERRKAASNRGASSATAPTTSTSRTRWRWIRKGRLFVGDRGNNRIKIFDQDGKLLDTWYQFSRPSGIFIDAQDNIYVADSESGSVDPARAPTGSAACASAARRTAR